MPGVPSSPRASAEGVVPESEVERLAAEARERLTRNDGGRPVLRAVEPDADLPQTLFTYEDHVTVDGLTVATAFRGYRYVPGQGRGEFRNEAFADSISFRRPFDRSRLEAPEGARFVPPPSG